MPDLIRMQCERRSLLRQGEVWTFRILRTQDARALVQVLILQNTLPEELRSAANAHFEASARCLPLPPLALCVWQELDTICLALTDENGPVYFQALTDRTLSPECLRDIRFIQWEAEAQGWIPSPTQFILVGDWADVSPMDIEKSSRLPTRRIPRDLFTAPTVSMELTPHAVKELRKKQRQRRRIQLASLGVAALYAAFLAVQILSGIRLSWSNHHLQQRLDALMPRVTEMQTTARRMDALNPALDVRTYPLEILYRATAILPERGVRLTRFEVSGNQVQIAGESSTAREAFDYINALEATEDLNHIEWEDAPQPIPLPNDTTRFSIQGTISGAYQNAEET